MALGRRPQTHEDLDLKCLRCGEAYARDGAAELARGAVQGYPCSTKLKTPSSRTSEGVNRTRLQLPRNPLIVTSSLPSVRWDEAFGKELRRAS
jgi:hypothetical protein